MEKVSISGNDVAWGYVAQICNIGANILILPALFYYLKSDVLGVWYVFLNIGMFATMFGLVFQSSFARNISYAFAGATSLQKNGINTQSEILDEPNLPLVKGLIGSMRKFYGVISLCFALLLVLCGSFYMSHLSKDLIDSHVVVDSWILYSISISLGFYCLHYGSILQGRGCMKELNQLTIVCRLVYIFLIYWLISRNFGIWSIAIANFVSVIAGWIMGNLLAYKGCLRKLLKEVSGSSPDLLKLVWHNTYKLALATLLIYLSTKGNLFYVSLFLPLDVIARYGLSLQVMNVFASISLLYYYNYSPLIARKLVEGDWLSVKHIYSKSVFVSCLLFIVGSVFLLFWGDSALRLIGSKTSFLSFIPLLLLCITYFFDSNHTLALNLMVTSNRVVHLKASFVSAIAIFLLIPLFVKTFHWGITGAILAVMLVQLCYHNWRWIMFVSKKMNLGFFKQLALGVKSFRRGGHR